MTEARSLNPAPRWILFLALTIAGLLYVKWLPYWDKALGAAAKHAIGGSILMGKADHAPPASLQSALAYANAYGKAIWKAMVLGLLLGSGVQALLPADWIARVLGRTRLGAVMAGGLLGAPAMMCTCCAAPVVVGLRRSRASVGAAIAFWLGNTVLNPATLVFTGFVLGWGWTGLRLALGVVMVFGLGWLANRLASPADETGARAAVDTLSPANVQEPTLRRWLRLLVGMTVRLVPEYVVLVLLLGAARAWLFPALGPQIGNHLVWIVAFAAAGAVFVIPTAGEVPIIQAMRVLGVGAGPAGALLMTLPPISLPSLAMVSRDFPPRILAVVIGAVFAFGLIGGALAIALRL